MALRSLPERLAASRRFRAALQAREVPPAPAKPPKFWRRLAFIGAVALLSVAAVFVLRPAAEDWLLQRWEQQLVDDDSNTSQAARMSAAAQQGDWGLRLLVAATSSPNEEANRAACRELHSMLQRWSTETGVDHSPDIQSVVHYIVVRKSQYSPEQLARLAPVVERLVAWPVLSENVVMKQYLQDSETLVRLMVDFAPLAREEEPEVVAESKTNNIPPAVEIASRSPAILPAGDVPVSAVPIEPVPAEQIPAQASPIPAQTTPLPELSPSPTLIQPGLESGQSGPSLMLEMLPANPGGMRRLDDSQSSATPNATMRLPLSAEEELPAPSRRWMKWSDWQVIRMLPRAPQEAEQELRERGFATRDIAIAKRASATEPEVRLQLVQDLPRMTGIDARLWLRQLAEDSDRSVRETANAILQTAYSGPLQGSSTIRR